MSQGGANMAKLDTPEADAETGVKSFTDFLANSNMKVWYHDDRILILILWSVVYDHLCGMIRPGTSI